MYDRIIDVEGINSENAAVIMKRLADISFERHSFEEALSLYNSVYEWCKQNNAYESDFALDIMMCIAELYHMFNRYDDRYEICRNALDISLEAYGENDAVTYQMLKNLADSCT